MTEAVETNSITRRMFGALIGATAATAVAPALAMPHPDAALIDACKAYLALDVERKAACEIYGGDDEALDAATVEMWEELGRLRDAILAMEAMTLDGILARAETYATFVYDAVCKGYPSEDTEWLSVMLTDVRTFRTRVR